MRRLVAFVSAFVVVGSGYAVASLPAAASDTGTSLSVTSVQQMVVDEAASYLFLGGADGVFVSDLAGAPVTAVTVGAVSGLVLSEDGTTLYASRPASDDIAVIDVATLTEQLPIATGASTCPGSLSFVGSTLWFGYGCAGQSGGIGAVELSSDPAVVALDLARPLTGGGFGSAPLVEAAAQAPGRLFVADPGYSMSTVDVFTVSGSAVLARTGMTQPFARVNDLAVSSDGQDLLVSLATGTALRRYAAADLADRGSITVTGSSRALAIASDGRIALGLADASQPAVYTFAADGSFQNQYIAGLGAFAVDVGFSGDASTLYAVTFDALGYTLHVITDLDATTPPAPSTPAITPDLHAIDLQWGHIGLNSVDTVGLYRGTDPAALTKIADVPATNAATQTWTDTGVAAGVTYYYAVTASSAGGESELSATVSTVRDESAVVFVTNRYTINNSYDIAYASDHGPLHRITAVSGSYDTPAFSPDGASVVYTALTGGVWHLWVAPLAGGAPRQLTSGDINEGSPAWSPDGRTIAYARTTPPGSSSVWTVPAAGGTPRQIPGSIDDADPAWAPNGTLLALTHEGPGTVSIAVTSLDGTYRRAVSGTDGSTYIGTVPSWSPDGSKIAFVLSSPSVDRVAVVPSIGGLAFPLTIPSLHAWTVSWSPDGTRIVFDAQTTPTGPPTSYQVAAAGGTATTVNGATASWNFAPSAFGARALYAPVTTPPAVSNVSGQLRNGAVALSWTRPAAAAYIVVRRSAPGGAAPTSPADGVAVSSGTASSVVAAGLSNGSMYRFAIFPMSAIGDAGPATVRAVQTAPTPLVTPNGTVLTALSGNGPRFTAAWGKPLPAGQVYDVQIGRRTQNATTHAWSTQPVWSALASGTRATSQVVNAAAGTTYYLRARVRDAAGNTTPFSTAAVAPVPYDDRAMTRTSTWTTPALPGSYANTIRTSTRAGASLSLTTYGSAFTLIANKCPTCGQARVYLDGKLRATIDTRATTTRARQVVWTLRLGPIGRHTVKVTVLGTAHRPAVRIDGLIAAR